MKRERIKGLGKERQSYILSTLSVSFSQPDHPTVALGFMSSNAQGQIYGCNWVLDQVRGQLLRLGFLCFGLQGNGYGYMHSAGSKVEAKNSVSVGNCRITSRQLSNDRCLLSFSFFLQREELERRLPLTSNMVCKGNVEVLILEIEVNLFHFRNQSSNQLNTVALIINLAGEVLLFFFCGLGEGNEE